MRRIPATLLQQMAVPLDAEDRDEMAIPSYLHRNPLMRWMAWRRVEVLAGRLRATAAGRDGARASLIMDYGCGTGVLFDEACQAAESVVGVDLVLDAAQMLIDQWQLERVSLATPERARQEVGDGTVDIILAAEVLEHVEPLDEVLGFFARSLKPSGKLLVSLPTENALYRFGRRLAGFEGHYHHSNAASIDAEMQRCGFRRTARSCIPGPGPLAIYWVADYEKAPAT